MSCSVLQCVTECCSVYDVQRPWRTPKLFSWDVDDYIEIWDLWYKSHDLHYMSPKNSITNSHEPHTLRTHTAHTCTRTARIHSAHRHTYTDLSWPGGMCACIIWIPRTLPPTLTNPTYCEHTQHTHAHTQRTHTQTCVDKAESAPIPYDIVLIYSHTAAPPASAATCRNL